MKNNQCPGQAWKRKVKQCPGQAWKRKDNYSPEQNWKSIIARDRSRTCTPSSQDQPLKLARLPVPPPGLKESPPVITWSYPVIIEPYLVFTGPYPVIIWSYPVITGPYLVFAGTYPVITWPLSEINSERRGEVMIYYWLFVIESQMRIWGKWVGYKWPGAEARAVLRLRSGWWASEASRTRSPCHD